MATESRDRALAGDSRDRERLALATKLETADSGSEPDVKTRMERRLTMLSRLDQADGFRRVLEVGCGPKPYSMRILLEKGYEVRGVEPVSSYVDEAREYLGLPELVLQGSAELIPLQDESQEIAFMGSVLEHVESPLKSLQELYRVLVPGGIAWITTTNRFRISLRGYEAEFNVRFYGWLPATVKESFVFHHLHHDPRLANYTERPAVHWFSYADLCDLGRSAGFYQFYSPVDLQRVSDDPDPSSGTLQTRVRRAALPRVQANPWLRALFLVQRGGDIIMLKRGEAPGGTQGEDHEVREMGPK